MPEDAVVTMDSGPFSPVPEEADAADLPNFDVNETRKLKQRLKISERYKQREFQAIYETSKRLMRGLHFPESHPGGQNEESRVIVNLCQPIVKTKVSTVGFRYPEFNLTPLNPQSADRVHIANAAMRHEWKISYTQREAVRALHDKEVFGFGIVMTGWDFQTKTGIMRRDGRSDVVGEEMDPSTVDFDAMAEAVAKTGSPTGGDQEDVEQEDVITDQFYCKRISPWNFLIDPEGDWVIQNHEYLGYIEMVPLNSLKQDPRLKNTRGLQGTSRGLMNFLDNETLSKRAEDYPTDIKRVKVYHYYEKKRQIYAMFCDEHDKPLLVQKWAWEHDRYPFRIIHQQQDEDTFYDLSPVQMVQSQQEEVNVTRTMLRNHIRRFTRKYMTARGMLDRQAKNQLKSSIDGAIVEHNGGPEAVVIKPIDHATIPTEVYQTDQMAMQDMRFITGLDEYQTNNVGKTRRTAQEVEQIRQAGGTRAAADGQIFEQFCAEIGEDLLDLLMQYSQKTRSIPVYSPTDNVQSFADFTADDIKGEYLVDVYIGSTMPQNSSDKQQTYAWLLQTLAPFAQQPDPQTGQPMIQLRPLVKGLLGSFPEIHNLDEILSPETPTVQPQQPPGYPQPGEPPQGTGQPQQQHPDYANALMLGLPNPLTPDQMMENPLFTPKLGRKV